MAIEQLKDAIREAITNISCEACENITKNAIERARPCTTSEGGNLFDIIFHI